MKQITRVEKITKIEKVTKIEKITKLTLRALAFRQSETTGKCLERQSHSLFIVITWLTSTHLKPFETKPFMTL